MLYVHVTWGQTVSAERQVAHSAQSLIFVKPIAS